MVWERLGLGPAAEPPLPLPLRPRAPQRQADDAAARLAEADVRAYEAQRQLEEERRRAADLQVRAPPWLPGAGCAVLTMAARRGPCTHPRLPCAQPPGVPAATP